MKKNEITINENDIVYETEFYIYVKGRKLDDRIAIDKEKYSIKINKNKYRRGLFDKATSTYY